jgi:hypothetical protein
MNMSGKQIREGSPNEEFIPFFQPVVTLHTGEIAGVDVLARWQHRSFAIVLPGAFIAIAEQEGSSLLWVTPNFPASPKVNQKPQCDPSYSNTYRRLVRKESFPRPGSRRSLG